MHTKVHEIFYRNIMLLQVTDILAYYHNVIHLGLIFLLVITPFINNLKVKVHLKETCTYLQACWCVPYQSGITFLTVISFEPEKELWTDPALYAKHILQLGWQEIL